MGDSDGGTGPDLLEAQRRLLQQAGGLYTVGEAAQRLGITKEAIRQRLQEGRLLSLQHSSEVWLPRVQFDESGTLEGLECVLEAMHVTDEWMRLQLFLDVDVIGALQDGRVEDAVSAVNSYLPRDGPESREP